MKQESVQQKKLWEVDPEYLIYLRSHHPEAIEFIRKNFAALKDGEQVRKTNSIWLDIQQYTEFSGLDPDKSRLPNTDNVILFRTISFAVFPRKIKPQYIETSEKDDCDYNRYITWETATRDIQNQKKTGYKGEKWLLKCKLKIFVSGKKTIVTPPPEKIKYVRNPELQKYLKSTEYQKYLDDCLIYQDEWEAYRAFRMSYHSFTLPDGSVKSLLLYNRPEEKFAMLRNLGVAESEIQHYRDILANKPVKPVPADLKPLIPQVIPSRSIQKNVWDWKHSIETIERVKSKNNGKTQACKTTKARMPKKTKTEVPVART